jgi:hypothetical protein
MATYRINYGEYSDQETVSVEANSFEEALQNCGIENDFIWSIEKEHNVVDFNSWSLRR